MSTDWTAEQKAVYEDLKEEGFAITVRVPGSPGAFDEDELEYTGATDDTDYTTYGIKKRYSLNQIDGKIIQRKDTRLIFPAYGLPDITPDHQILIGSAVQNVVNIDPVEPGNVALLYECQVRS